jgi:hypothetical protein
MIESVMRLNLERFAGHFYGRTREAHISRPMREIWRGNCDGPGAETDSKADFRTMVQDSVSVKERG